jgi:coenzyme F420-reducing hydrogenase delta subunit/ferredoxin
VPAVLKLDWFYLNVYPLLDKWPADQVWLLTTSVTLLLMIMPWLPPRKTGPAAVVHLDQCNGCGQCAEDCPFDAITVQARSDGARWKNEVVVNPAQCSACGICVASCHSSNPFRHATRTLETGIDMPQLPIEEIRTLTRSMLAGLKGDSRIMVFGCDNAIDIKELQAENVAVLSLFCTGMIPPTLVEYAQSHGADGVFITGCRSGDCYFRLGNIWLDQRFEGRRKPVLRQRARRERITVFRAAATDSAKLRSHFDGFQRHIAALGKDDAASRTTQYREESGA